MLEEKVKINLIVENQLPEFVRDEFPLVSEFLSQYYLSLESQGQPYDLMRRIDDYIKVDNLVNLDDSTILTSDVDVFDKTIFVQSTKGFPNKYGLLQINDEIITYTEKTSNSFIGCKRGFSGVTSYDDPLQKDKLVFSVSKSSNHKSSTKVNNLSILFFKKFLYKIKLQFTPGFESRELVDGLNENIFIKQVRNFYESKGTIESFRILFYALYGTPVEVIRPSDYVIEASNADYAITQEIVAEVISGNPYDLINGTLYQDFDGGTARGTITNVERIRRVNKDYYKISLDYDYDRDIRSRGTFENIENFKINPKTIILSDIALGSNYIDVDSTVGFPQKGELSVDLANGSQLLINYSSKSLNQFFDCVGITQDIPSRSEIKLNEYAYGYSQKNSEIVKIRLTGVLSDFKISGDPYLCSKEDTIQIKTLGSDLKDLRSNNWFFNIPVEYDVKSIILLDSSDFTYKITLYDEHRFIIGDRFSLVSQIGDQILGTIDFVESRKINVVIKGNARLDTNLTYVIKKLVSKVNLFNYEELNYYNSNVQNVYYDLEESIYVASPSLPAYKNRSLRIDDRSTTFYGSIGANASGSGIPEYNLVLRNEAGSPIRHPYYTGDSVVYKTGNPNAPITENGVYFIKRINATTIRLSKSRENIFQNIYVELDGISINDRIELFEFNDRNLNLQTLKPQPLLKKISNPIDDGNEYETKPGTTGILINGVEILNYKSSDTIFYGQIENIIPTAGGEDYDIINPPILDVENQFGLKCNSYCGVTGGLSKIEIIDPGFDYLEVPNIIITGGSGFGAKAKVNLITFDHIETFLPISEVNISTDEIQFSDYHKFRNFEEVIYNSGGNLPVSNLINNSSYFVSVQDEYTVRLHKSFTDAVAGINTINLTTLSNGTHSLKSKTKKKKVGSISISDPGYGYKNKKTSVSISGISTSSGILTIKDHGYQNGEIIKYSYSGTPISGLSSISSYYVSKVNDNQFRLSEYVESNSIGVETSKSLTSDFYYKSKKYVKFNDTGSGEHYFNYEPINVEIKGKVGVSSIGTKTFGAVLSPIFRGSITSVFVQNGGSGYGSEEILNYNKQPNYKFETGFGCQLIPIISDGKIIDVVVQNSGLNYNTPPDLVITGSGSGCILTPILEGNQIVDIKVISTGGGYEKKNTFIDVIPKGFGAKFDFIINSWKVNIVERNIRTNKITSDDGFITYGSKKEFGLQYTHTYAPRPLRQSVLSTTYRYGDVIYTEDLKLSNGREQDSKAHSPIIGWAYDGNPIYGPYGYQRIDGGDVVILKSGYTIKTADKLKYRPSSSTYPIGFFVEDYEFTSSGDLDEYNGRFCTTPEYPNGIYAYFCTINTETVENIGVFNNYRKPTFPYVIGNKFKSRPIEYNFNPDSNQIGLDLNETNWVRNTSPYNLLNKRSRYNYLFNSNNEQKQLSDVRSIIPGVVQRISVENSGQDYKVEDEVIFDNKNYGYGAKAEIESVKGSDIKNISVEQIELNDVELLPYRSFIGIKTTTNKLRDGDIVNISTQFESDIITKIKLKPSVKLSLISGISSVSTTGIITNFKVSGNLDSDLYENDLLTIGDEVVKILNIDRKLNVIQVQRDIESTSGITSHSSGTILKEKENKFIVNLGLSTTYNLKRDREYYFDSNRVVGLGTTYGVGITSTKFLDVENFRSKVTIGAGTSTILYFDRQTEKQRYSLNNFINIIDATNSGFNTSKTRVTGVGDTFIRVEFNTSALSVGLGVTAYINKWKIVRVPTRSIFIPDHQLELNDPITYTPPENGDPILVIDPEVPSVEFPLPSIDDDQPLYAVPITNDYIGISTIPVNVVDNDSLLLFSDAGSNFTDSPNNSDIHKISVSYDKKLKSKIIKNLVTVETNTEHNLNLGDYVNLNCLSGISTTIKVKYNDYNRRMVIGEFNFLASDVNIEYNSIQIYNHNFKNGDKVIHQSSIPCGGLENEKIYYIFVVDQNTIKFVDEKYKLYESFPDFIQITSSSFGRISNINPLISVTKFSDLTFDVSDDSLSFIRNGISYPAFELSLYTDRNFKHKFLSSKSKTSFEVEKTGIVGVTSDAKITIQFDENLPEILYYKLNPIDLTNNLSVKSSIIVDDEQNNHSTINLISSKYSGEHRVIDTDPNPFKFKYIITNYPERGEYTKENAILTYTTESKNVKGPINSIKLLSNGSNYKKLPSIKKIESIDGKNALLKIESNNIGKFGNFEIEDIGFDYSCDLTIRPKFKFPDILYIKGFYEVESIDVLSIGKNYTNSPDLVIIDPTTNNPIEDLLLDFDIFNKKVNILENTTGISDVDLKAIPTNNSNGFSINSVGFNTLTKDVTLTLTTEFSSGMNFPFKIGTKILVENVSVASTEKGYNSKDYDYNLFTVVEIDTQTGGSGAKVIYNMSEFLNETEKLGTYDKTYSKGYVTPEDYFPKFKFNLRKKTFLNQELIVTENFREGTVEEWDKDNELLKISTNNDFYPGELIYSKTSNNAAKINKIISFEGFYDIKPLSIVRYNWKTERGFLNNQFQRIHDSDYYQYFSYSLKSNVTFDKWDESVDALNHTVGFKKFSDLQIQSSPLTSGISTSQDMGEFSAVSDFYSEIDINCVNDFDLVKENYFYIDNNLRSNEIYFENKIIQDYIESFGNRAIVLDDLSQQFNSNPRATPFSIVDTFNITDFRYRKYFIYAVDKSPKFDYESEFTIISILHDDEFGYINEYGKSYNNNLIGSFEFRVFGTDAELLFYPRNFEVNNYDLNYLVFDIKSTETSAEEKSYGDAAQIKSTYYFATENQTSPITIFDIPSSYKSVKCIAQICALDNSYFEIDELVITHDGTNVSITQYGQLTGDSGASRSISGFGSYIGSISNGNLIVELIPDSATNPAVTINSFNVCLLDKTASFADEQLLDQNLIRSSLVTVPSLTKTLISEFSREYSSAYLIISVEDPTGTICQVSEVVLMYNRYILDENNDKIEQDDAHIVEFGITRTTEQSLGDLTVEVDIPNDAIQLYFTPQIPETLNITSFEVILGKTREEKYEDLTNASIGVGFGFYRGTKVDIKKSFPLTHKTLPIFKQEFLSEDGVIDLSTNKFRLPRNFFATGEEVIYKYERKPILIEPTNVAGIGITDILPSRIFIIKSDELDIQVAVSASDALNVIPKPVNIVGIGTGKQRFISTKENTKAIISLDNIIQSPIVGTYVTTNLVQRIGVFDTTIKVAGISSIFGGDYLRIVNNETNVSEIMRVISVGFGSTNAILVDREWIGSGISSHLSGSLVTKVKGNYNINENIINFAEPPYGKVPILNPSNRFDEIDYTGVEVTSKFNGRVFLRSGSINSTIPTYSDNFIFDDISEQFDGYNTSFTLTQGKQNISGISSNNAILLINNVFQMPSRNDGSIIISGDYDFNESSGITSVKFSGEPIPGIDYDVNVAKIPKGGIIVSVGSTQGFGYQPIVSAGGTVVVSAAGTISAVSIGNSGSGYRRSEKYDIITNLQANVAAGSTEFKLKNVESLFQKLKYSSNNSITVGSAVTNVSIVGYTTDTVLIAPELASSVAIPNESSAIVTLNSPQTTLINVGITTRNSSDNQYTHLGFTTSIKGYASNDIIISNPGFGYTNFYILNTTTTNISSGVGTTVFYVNSTFEEDNISEIYVSIGTIIIDAPIVSVSSTSFTIGAGSTSNVQFNAGTNIVFKKYSPPHIIFDQPLSYSNIPLVYLDQNQSGVGTGGRVDIVVSQDSTIVSFEFRNLGYGYKKGQVLTIPTTDSYIGVPTDISKPFERFELYIDEAEQDDFASWSFGSLQVLDPIENLFDGSRRSFPLQINGIQKTIKARKGSNIDVQATLLVFVNGLLQVPGESYIFKGGSIITFTEAPKVDDTCKLLFYAGTSEIDTVDVDVLESVKIGDTLKINSQSMEYEQEDRFINQILSVDVVETNLYSRSGISSNELLVRPIEWCKQISDTFIDGNSISKSRINYEPLVYPTTNIITGIDTMSDYFFVDNLKTFFDSKTENNINSNNKLEIISQKNVRSAFATAVVSISGTISSIEIVDGGIGYDSNSTVSIQDPKNYIVTSLGNVGIKTTLIVGIDTTNIKVGYDIIGFSTIFTKQPIVSLGTKIESISTDSFNITKATLNDVLELGVEFSIGIGTTALASSVVSLAGTISTINIQNSGSGYSNINPPVVLISPPKVDKEFIFGASYEGDFGQIVGIKTEKFGMSLATSLVFDFYIPNDSYLRNTNINVGIATTGISGIKTDYYFVIKNSNIGTGITSIDNSGNVIGFGSIYVDGIYQAISVSLATTSVLGVGTTSIIRVTSRVQNYDSLVGIGTSGMYGEFSWGRISNIVRKTPREFEVYRDGISGINSSPILRRSIPLKYRDYI
jgi:hypothetical protein